MLRVSFKLSFSFFKSNLNKQHSFKKIGFDLIKRKSKNSYPGVIKLLYMYSIPLSIPSWPFFKKQDSPCYKYWTCNTEELIELADELYRNQKYTEVYEILNRLKFYNNPEVLWRIARVLYKLSCTSGLTADIKESMVLEAVDIVNHALTLGNDNANVHKWTAIILDCKYNLEGIKAKINGLETIRYHIAKAVELDDSQTALFHMLGKLSYDLANLNWFQRKIAILLFEEPPGGSFEVAYDYFIKAEQSSPGFYIGNLVMLAKTAIKLGRLQQAKYFLQLATHYTPTSEEDKKLKAEARQLSKTLDQFEFSQSFSDNMM